MVQVIRARSQKHQTCTSSWMTTTGRLTSSRIRDPETVDRLLVDRSSGFWIAYVNGVPAGCVVLRPLEQFQSAGECKRLYVRAQFRRRRASQRRCWTRWSNMRVNSHSSCIYLDSKDDLRAAIALYRRRGYQSCERYNDDPQATIFLRKSLSSGR